MTGLPEEARNAVARYLRQRVELGEVNHLFEAVDARAARALLDRSRAADLLPTAGDAPSPRPPLPPRNQTSASAPPGPELPRSLPQLREVAAACTRCALAGTRTHVVFADGPEDATLMVIGEAPGQQEDERGLPFVGPAGKLLDLLLATISRSRETDTWIANVLKCRPPGNRNPLPEEIEACSPFLRRQVELVRPRAILAVGTFSGQWVSGSPLPLGKLRGTVHRYEGIPAVVTYHPAALLRNSGWVRSAWEDLQLLVPLLDP